MITKIYEKLKQFMQENWKYLVVLIGSYLLLTFPLPYYIYVGGGTININDRVTIASEAKAKGSLNFAYVKELKGNLSNFLLAKVLPGWDIEKEDDFKLSEDETKEDIEFRNHIYLENANQTATLIAYQKALKTIEVKKQHFYVLYVKEQEKDGLQVGDELKSVEGKMLASVKDYSDIVASKEVGEKLQLIVLRKNKEHEVSITIKDYNGKKLSGITISTIYEYETDPELSFSFKSSESGPSGGLMLTLAIYNKLVKEDITHGKKIVGTGTIEEDGSVGSIGGIKYKLKGAVDSKASLFLAPAGENYEEAIKEKKKHGYQIEIASVSSFDEALSVLKKQAMPGEK